MGAFSVGVMGSSALVDDVVARGLGRDAWAACQAGFALTEVAMFMRRAGSHSTIIFLRDNASIDEQLIGQVAIDFVRSNTERTEQTQTEAA